MEPEGKLTLRLRLPLVWLGLLLAGAILLPGRVWTTLLIGLGGLFLVAYLWARQLAAHLRAARRLSFGWVAVGDRLEERFEIANGSLLPALWVEVVDHSNVPGYRAGVVRSVGDRQIDQWRQTAVCTRRGQFHLGPWRLRTRDPFGIFEVVHDYPTTQDIVIHPPIHRQLPITLPSGQRSGRVRARQMAWQATINAAAVRAYQPTDPQNWIHWPTTARQSELHVRQFDLDTAGDLWILLDMAAAPQLGEGADGTEEHAVLLAASLAARALRQNRAVGLASYGQAPFVLPPARGEGQQWRLLRALALAEADGEYGLERALRDLQRTARRGAAAVVITPRGDADWIPALFGLARRGVQGSIVLLNRASFGGDTAARGLRDVLRGQGFQVHVVRQGETGRPTETAARRGYWDFIVTGTGKVVVKSRPDTIQ